MLHTGCRMAVAHRSAAATAAVDLAARAGVVAVVVVVVDRLVDCRHRWARCPLRWDPLRASRNRFAALGDWTAGLKESEKKN